MADIKEELHYDENTLRKVYEGLLKAGIFGQQAVDAVSEMQNQGILFRENKPKRRGRPRKPAEESIKELEADLNSGTKEDPWAPNPAELDGLNGNA